VVTHAPHRVVIAGSATELSAGAVMEAVAGLPGGCSRISVVCVMPRRSWLTSLSACAPGPSVAFLDMENRAAAEREARAACREACHALADRFAADHWVAERWRDVLGMTATGRCDTVMFTGPRPPRPWFSRRTR
jgi:hypothetical protein